MVECQHLIFKTFKFQERSHLNIFNPSWCTLRKMTILKKDGINFNVGIDPSETIWKRYAKGSIPKNFLIDKKGIIRYVSTGNIEGGLDKISTMIKEFLKE